MLKFQPTGYFTLRTFAQRMANEDKILHDLFKYAKAIVKRNSADS